jgi:chemotaxis protein CheD
MTASPAPRSLFGRDESGLPRIFLLPGTMHCTPASVLVTTVLGSCVAVCLSDRQRRFSGINHFLLPNNIGGRRSLRYGDVAIDRLLAAMLEFGARLGDLEAKVFGGAAVLHTNTPDHNVGTQNIAIAVERLKALDIPIVGRRTGGKNGLAVRLYTQSGDVLVRRIDAAVAQQIAKKPAGTRP